MTAVRALQLQRTAGAMTGGRVQRFALAGARELRARRSTLQHGAVSITLALHDHGTPTGHFVVKAEDLAGLARAMARLAETTPMSRHRGRDQDDDEGAEHVLGAAESLR